MAIAQAACANLAASISAATARASDELSSTGSVKTSTLGSLIGVIKTTCSLLNLSSVKDVDKLARKSFMHESVREAWEDLAQAIRGERSASCKLFCIVRLSVCLFFAPPESICGNVCVCGDVTACCRLAAWDKLVEHVDQLSLDSSHCIPSTQLALPTDAVPSDTNPLFKKQRVAPEESRDSASASASADAIPAHSVITMRLTDVTACAPPAPHSSSLTHALSPLPFP